MLITASIEKTLRDMPTLELDDNGHMLKIERAGIRVWLSGLEYGTAIIEKIYGGYWENCGESSTDVLETVLNVMDEEKAQRARSAEFVVAINFDVDSLASVMAEQHNDAVVEVIRRVIELKDDPRFGIALSNLV